MIQPLIYRTVALLDHQLFSLTTLASSMIYLPGYQLEPRERFTFFVLFMPVGCRDVHPPQDDIAAHTIEVRHNMLAGPADEHSEFSRAGK
jgi:hypothetical protein